MKKSMAKVLAGALSLAMAVTLVTPSNAAAASKPKFSKTYGKLYSNAVYTVKNVKKGYKVKVAVSGTAKSAVTPTKSGKKVTTIKATGSTVKFTAAVKASATTAGKGATVTATVYNTKGKKVKTLKDGVRVMSHTVGLTLTSGAATTEVGTEVQLTTTKAPAYSTDSVSYSVTPATGAAVTSDGKFTATTAGTYQVVAVSNGVASDAVSITVAEKAATEITEVKAIAANKLQVTFNGVSNVSGSAFSVKRGSTDVTVKTEWAADNKSAVLSSDSAFAAGDYNVTYGTMSGKVSITAQKASKLVISTDKIALAENDLGADVYFAVLDQYGEDMKYSSDKLTITATDVTKGVRVDPQTTSTKNGKFQLGASATVGCAVGDTVHVVAYLKDDVSVIATKDLTIARVYTDTFKFGDVDLGKDARVTVNKEYSIAYEAMDSNGQKVLLTKHSGAWEDNRVVTNGLTFVSSNKAIIDPESITIDADGKLKFKTKGYDGSVVLTAVNNTTGTTSSVTIVVNKEATPSKLVISEVSAAANTYGPTETKVKAAITVYDQFGTMLNATDVKNLDLVGKEYFQAPVYVPQLTGVTISSKITSDGKYIEWILKNTNKKDLEKNSVTVNFISKTDNSISTAKIVFNEASEASNLVVKTEPASSIVSGKKTKIKVEVQDQYDNKVKIASDATYDEGTTKYYLGLVDSDDLLAGETEEYFEAYNDKDIEVTAATTEKTKSGTITVELRKVTESSYDVIVSKSFKVSVVPNMNKYSVKADKDEYKVGDEIKLTIEAYHNDDNGYINDYAETEDLVITIGSTTYNRKVKFEGGTATVTVKAATSSDSKQDIEINRLNGDSLTNAESKDAQITIKAASASILRLNESNGDLTAETPEGETDTEFKDKKVVKIKAVDKATGADVTKDFIADASYTGATPDGELNVTFSSGTASAAVKTSVVGSKLKKDQVIIVTYTIDGLTSVSQEITIS